MPHSSTKKLILSLSVAAALAGASGSTFADGDDITALEARIAELEAMVRQLMAERTEAPAPAGDMGAEMDAKARAAADAAIAAYKAEEEEKAKKHSYAFGGYIKADFMYSNYDSGSYSGAGRDFYIPATIPVGGSSGESYTDFHAKESRINFKSTHLLDGGHKVTTYLEMDAQLSGQGDERISNSWSPRIRHAFVSYDKWLFGKTWMTFYNVTTNPENLDFVGPADGSLFGRQAQIRYTTGPWMFAIENPETTVTPFGGGGRIVTDDNKMPDVVARYNMSGDWGTFSVAGMLRQLRYENPSAGISDSTSAWAISLTGKVMLGRDDFRWMVSTGAGLGRYIGLNTQNGAVLDANGNLEAIDQTGVFGSYRHFWNDKWRSNFTLGYLRIDNDTSLTGTSATKDASSVHLNLIYSPLPKLDFGIELMLADREIESGADGNLTRLQFSAKYAY